MARGRRRVNMTKEKVLVFGTGEYCNRMFREGRMEYFDVVGFVDNDKSKQGKILGETV